MKWISLRERQSGALLARRVIAVWQALRWTMFMVIVRSYADDGFHGSPSFKLEPIVWGVWEYAVVCTRPMHDNCALYVGYVTGVTYIDFEVSIICLSRRCIMTRNVLAVTIISSSRFSNIYDHYARSSIRAEIKSSIRTYTEFPSSSLRGSVRADWGHRSKWKTLNTFHCVYGSTVEECRA